MNIDRTTRPSPTYRTQRDHVPRALADRPMQYLGEGTDPLRNAPQIVRDLSGPNAANAQPPLDLELPNWPRGRFDTYA